MIKTEMINILNSLELTQLKIRLAGNSANSIRIGGEYRIKNYNLRGWIFFL